MDINAMKKIILTLNLILLSILTYSQTKIYEAPNGKTLTEEEYKKAKISSLANAKQNIGADYELYEKLEITEENKNEVRYKFNWEYLNEEMRAEKLIEEKLIGKTLEFQTLNFLNSKEKNKLDKDKPTFVNFWFTSCPPCIEEMPALNELKEKYKDRINFVSITFDTKEKVEKFLKKYEFDYVKYTAEYTALNAKASILKYFKEALINNWADEYIVKKKVKDIKQKEKEKEVIEEAVVVEEKQNENAARDRSLRLYS